MSILSEEQDKISYGRTAGPHHQLISVAPKEVRIKENKRVWHLGLLAIRYLDKVAGGVSEVACKANCLYPR